MKSGGVWRSARVWVSDDVGVNGVVGMSGEVWVSRFGARWGSDDGRGCVEVWRTRVLPTRPESGWNQIVYFS